MEVYMNQEVMKVMIHWQMINAAPKAVNYFMLPKPN
jgi:hypothetical protein